MEKLSSREWEVVKLLFQGKSNKLIAAALGISTRTVEFHLKNIYAKYEVNSRLELVLKLTNTREQVESGKLGVSTVESRSKETDNSSKKHLQAAWSIFKRNATAIIGEEFIMKNWINSKHVRVGVLTALATGGVWLSLLVHFGHMSMNKFLPWVPALAVILIGIGLTVGRLGERKSTTLRRVFFGVLFGTGVGAFAMIPLTILVAVPVGKLFELVGLINRAALPNDLASGIAYAAMIVMWLVAGVGIGYAWLSIAGKKADKKMTM
jgi:DNA-binding CsgD family transcriptional regulator